jgi:two-component system sensor histidine kinase VicK
MVKDTGFGISREDLGRIFERFYRVKDDKTKNDFRHGSWSGHRESIVETHNGRIEAESESGPQFGLSCVSPRHAHLA